MLKENFLWSELKYKCIQLKKKMEEEGTDCKKGKECKCSNAIHTVNGFLSMPIMKKF